MTVFEISQKCSRSYLQLGFCEAWSIRDGHYVLVRPFQRFLLHSARGQIECRGVWNYGRILPENDYELQTIERRPWMDIDIADVISVFDLCAECATELPMNGFRRPTIL